MKIRSLLAVASLSVGLFGTPQAGEAIKYSEDFNSGLPLVNLGFTGIAPTYWETQAGSMRSTTPGSWDALAKTYTPEFSGQRIDSILVVSWDVQFPTEYNVNWRENNKIWVGMCNARGSCKYELLFKPNRPQDAYTSYDMELVRYPDQKNYPPGADGPGYGVLQQALTNTVTPHGAGAAFVHFEMRFDPNGTISVWYDAGTGNSVEYIRATDAWEVSGFSKIRFTYKTGVDAENSFVNVDSIVVKQASVY